MSKKQKLIDRFKSKPKDFTFDELRTLLRHLGYNEMAMGNTSGSRVKFMRTETKHVLSIHKPHPKPILKEYAVKYILEALEEEGLI